MSMSTHFGAVVPQQPVPPMPPSWPARYARFGKFQLDLENEELYESGRRCRVQAKVFQALLALLSRPGEIVTREEVCKRLWQDSVQVNFDANVNTTMNKLRFILGDSPDNPVYIETVPRRGYSFIAPVEFSNHAQITRLVTTPGPLEGVPVQTGIWARLTDFRSLPVRMLGLLLVGMLVGAILVLAWSFVASKGQRLENLGRQSALAGSASIGQTASALVAQHGHKL